MANLYQKYYETSDPEEKDRIRQEIEDRKETASWNGTEPDFEEHCEMGS